MAGGGAGVCRDWSGSGVDSTWSSLWCLCFFFFFQAEDGIRDYKVTGVQTCALPILLHARRERPLGPRDRLVGGGEGVTTDRTRPASSERKVRFGLLPKIILFLFAALVPLAAITWYVSVQTLRQKMTEEFTSKGMAIAKSLASSSVDLLLTRDASTVQSAIDQFAAISGVQYVVVYDAGRHLVAHTFAPLVPAGLVEKNVVPGDAVQQVKDVQYTDPVTGTESHIIDIGVPVLAGQLGTVRVGMDRAIIEAAAAGAGERLLFIFAGAAVVAVLAGVVFARRISKPIGEVVRLAERVGQGDLSKLVPVTSRDEIGQLAHTFNDTVGRLPSL